MKPKKTPEEFLAEQAGLTLEEFGGILGQGETFEDRLDERMPENTAALAYRIKSLEARVQALEALEKERS